MKKRVSFCVKKGHFSLVLRGGGLSYIVLIDEFEDFGVGEFGLIFLDPGDVEFISHERAVVSFQGRIQKGKGYKYPLRKGYLVPFSRVLFIAFVF